MLLINARLFCGGLYSTCMSVEHEMIFHFIQKHKLWVKCGIEPAVLEVLDLTHALYLYEELPD